jgi:hypothetical protein
LKHAEQLAGGALGQPQLLARARYGREQRGTKSGGEQAANACRTSASDDAFRQ